MGILVGLAIMFWQIVFVCITAGIALYFLTVAIDGIISFFKRI